MLIFQIQQQQLLLKSLVKNSTIRIYIIVFIRLNFTISNLLMQNSAENKQNSKIYSSFLQISDLKQLQQYCEYNLQRDSSSEYDEAINSNNSKPLKQNSTGSDKDSKKKLAGLRSRQKKKKYIQTLQQNVKSLSAQLQIIENQIPKIKDKLMEAIKISSRNANEHEFTYKELERSARQQYPDYDKINLLLDLIQNRIGANAKQRQSKLDYNFKQIVNSLFPAVHRYFMYSSIESLDLFQDSSLEQIVGCLWTKELFAKINLNKQQIKKLNSKKNLFIKKRRETITLIQRLKDIKNQLKNQQQIFEKVMSDIRRQINPVQSALMIVFGQNNKLRRQFSCLVDLFQEENKPKQQKD